jgi:hypothetical protein
MKTTKIYYLHRGDQIPIYIGKTNSDVKTKRIIGHKYNLGKDTMMEIIDEVPISEWKFWEKHYISLYKSWGFTLLNKNNGGGGSTTHTQKTKDKIGEKIKNNKERGDKISKTNKGLSKSNKGKKFTEEHKQKIKDTRSFLKGRKNTWGGKYAKIVQQFDLQGNFIREFNSIREACVYIGLKPTNSQIGLCANNRIKTSYGFIWKFKN